MVEVTAILLAAGLSRRMGARNKLLLPIAGVPMVRHMAEVYGRVGRVIVITGHEAAEVATALEGSGARTVFNPAYGEGQQTSVACGLRAVGPLGESASGPLLIGLADQPLLTAQDLRTLLDAHAAADRLRISIPAVDQRRGNPIVVPQALRARLLHDPKSPGCKSFTRANPDAVQFHALTSAGFYTDIDTPEAYAAVTAALSETAQ